MELWRVLLGLAGWGGFVFAMAYKMGHHRGRIDAMDEFGIIHGKAADSFLAEMEKTENASPEEKAKKRAFLDECEREYLKDRAKMDAPAPAPDGRGKKEE